MCADSNKMATKLEIAISGVSFLPGEASLLFLKSEGQILRQKIVGLIFSGYFYLSPRNYIYIILNCFPNAVLVTNTINAFISRGCVFFEKMNCYIYVP